MLSPGLGCSPRPPRAWGAPEICKHAASVPQTPILFLGCHKWPVPHGQGEQCRQGLLLAVFSLQVRGNPSHETLTLSWCPSACLRPLLVVLHFKCCALTSSTDGNKEQWWGWRGGHLAGLGTG